MVIYQIIANIDDMGRKKLTIPNMIDHAASGQSRVVWNGETIYLGKIGSPEATSRYQEIVSSILATGFSTPQKTTLVKVLVDRFISKMREDYPQSSDEPDQMARALRWLVAEHGESEAGSFSPLKLIDLREKWISKPLSVATINLYTSYVVRCFKWGAAREMVPPSVWDGLKAVERIKEGRTKAKPKKIVAPVEWSRVEAVRPFVSPVLWAVIQVQWLTGLRADEVLSMTPGEIDQKEWIYKPSQHKNLWRGKTKKCFIGPKAREILLPFLEGREPDKPLFSPAEAQEGRFAAMRAARKTKVQPSQISRAKPTPNRKPGEKYSTGSYYKAVQKACGRAGVKPWGTHQIRHARGTIVREKFGLEGAQVALDHSHARVTEIYAEKNEGLAKRISEELG